MTTYALGYAPQDYALEQVINDEQFVSLSGAVQTAVRTGNMFALSMSWVRSRTQYQALMGEIMRLHGRRHRMQIAMSQIGQIRRGVGGGTPLVDGAHSAGATSVALRGLPSSVTGILQAGDFLQIGNQLCAATSILTSSGTTGSVTIFPELHVNYSDSATVDYTTPKGIFMLVNHPGFTSKHDGVGSLSASFIQDVLA